MLTCAKLIMSILSPLLHLFFPRHHKLKMVILVLLLAAQVLTLPTPEEPSFTEVLAHIHASTPIQWNSTTLQDGQEARTTYIELGKFEDAKQQVFARRGMPLDLTDREQGRDVLEKRPVIIITPGSNRARSREGVNPFTGEKSKALEERGNPDSGEEEQFLRSTLEKRPKIIISPVKPGSRGSSPAILEKRPKIDVTPIDDTPRLAIRETDRETGRPREDRTYTGGRFSPRSLEERNIPAGYIWQTLCRNFGAITAWQNFVEAPSDAACNWFSMSPFPILDLFHSSPNRRESSPNARRLSSNLQHHRQRNRSLGPPAHHIFYESGAESRRWAGEYLRCMSGRLV
jgi:hypothetical protein